MHITRVCRIDDDYRLEEDKIVGIREISSQESDSHISGEGLR